MHTQMKQALVVGATGGIGGAVARRLLRSGWRVRGLSRNPPAADGRIAWMKGDALVAADVRAAAAGAELIVHAANPAGYRNWAGTVLPMLENSIAAARSAGARLLFPGTVYNYGPDAFPQLQVDSPQAPTTRKGALRVQMEAKLAEAAREGVCVLIVRAGDFFGPGAGNNWLAQGLVKPGRPLRSVSYPGPLQTPHAWAFLPDLAEAMVRLVERRDLDGLQRFHFKGHEITGQELVASLARVVGRPVAARRMPWFALGALAPWNETMRELLEVRYLWEEPVLLDNSRLLSVLGEEPHTPLDEALAATLRGLAIPTAAVPA